VPAIWPLPPYILITASMGASTLDGRYKNIIYPSASITSGAGEWMRLSVDSNTQQLRERRAFVRVIEVSGCILSIDELCDVINFLATN